MGIFLRGLFATENVLVEECQQSVHTEQRCRVHIQRLTKVSHPPLGTGPILGHQGTGDKQDPGHVMATQAFE